MALIQYLFSFLVTVLGTSVQSAVCIVFSRGYDPFSIHLDSPPLLARLLARI